MSPKPEVEQHIEHEILVREVSAHQTTWTERKRGAAGAFTIELILDHGVDEYVLRPEAEDAEVLTSCWPAPRRSTSIWSARC